MLIGTSTNTIYLRKFPFGNFDFQLFDENGKQIPKTKTGLTLTHTPLKPTKDDLIFWKRSGFRPFFIGVGDVNQNILFRADEMFEITNKGVYELKIQIRLCAIITNGVPDEAAMVDGRNATGRGLSSIKDFGILTSPPLRVEVIKE